jgi:hypothetical protein
LISQFDVFAYYDRTGFGNAIPGKAKFFTVNFTANFKTCFGVAIKIGSRTAKFYIKKLV